MKALSVFIFHMCDIYLTKYFPVAANNSTTAAVPVVEDVY